MVEITQEQLDELLGLKARVEELESEKYFKEIEYKEKEKMMDIEYEYAEYQRDKAVRMTEIQKFHRVLAKQKQEGVPESKRIGWNPDNLAADGGS